MSFLGDKIRNLPVQDPVAATRRDARAVDVDHLVDQAIRLENELRALQRKMEATRDEVNAAFERGTARGIAEGAPLESLRVYWAEELGIKVISGTRIQGGV